MARHTIVPSEQLDRRILDYVMTMTERGRQWWTDPVMGVNGSRHEEFTEYRLRMEGRRSVAELYHDAKDEPFEGAANIGTGLEGIFGEFLIPLLLANTHDLEPKLQALLYGTKQVNNDLTTFHDFYHHFEVPEKRALVEHSTRELLTIGTAFHKWQYQTVWEESELDLPIWLNPVTGLPDMFDAGDGKQVPRPADPKTPEERIPRDPVTGTPFRLSSMKAVDQRLAREGPELVVVPAERIGFPHGETRPDPNRWDWCSEDFEVTPFWLLGKEGEPFHGKLRLTPLWQKLGLDPDTLYSDPTKLASATTPIKLRAFYGKYPAASDGAPIEIAALVCVDHRLLLGWRPSPFTRRPYFNRQVWHTGTSPFGKGIPETLFSLRSAMDCILNQEIDYGNLTNHPVTLLSDLAKMEDEEYGVTGPGLVWTLRDINGVKFLQPPARGRDPVAMLNWLISHAMRMWGVSDLMLNAPSDQLSSLPSTARGTQAILNTGSIKFGHLTKRLSAVDTSEYQFVHDEFRTRLSNEKLVIRNGQPAGLSPAEREQYFAPTLRIVAVGNGISTNPILRQQTLTQFLTMALQLHIPFIEQDLEAYKQLVDQSVASYGIDLTLKDPEALEQSRVFLQLMQTPEGQRMLPAMLQTVMMEVQEHQATPASAAQNGATNGQPTNGFPQR